MGNKYLPLRLAALLLFIVILWNVIGAPRTVAEWQSAPGQVQMAWNQLPVRAGRILMQWPMAAPSTASGGSTVNKDQITNWVELLNRDAGWMIAVYDTDLGKTVKMPLEQYVAGVVAAEMPASYHLEALKAQAAAARTRAVWQAAFLGGTGCANHPGADICTDSTHCQSYMSSAKRAEKWGASALAYEERVCRAVLETKGSILTYDGKPITVLYHAVSGGHTEDVEAVFAQSLPYLRGVESRGEENTGKYQTEQTFTNEKAASLLNAAFPKAKVSADTLALELDVTQKTLTGRAAKVRVGSVEVTGRELREALALNSTLFSISFTESAVTFAQKGYGHGVGMSQAGANAMAAAGSSWMDILTHYYTGINIAKLPSL